MKFLSSKPIGGVHKILFLPIVLSIVLAVVGVVLWNVGLFQEIVGTKGFATVLFFLSLLSILFGWYSLQAGHKQREQLESVWRSSSTRYVGPFPHHLTEVFEVVDHARDELLIMTDCADYGSFSNPILHDKLLKAIQQASRRPSMGGRAIRVRMCLFGKRALSRNSPFYGRNFENDLRKDHKFEACLRAFLEFHQNWEKPNTDAEFEKMLLSEQKRVESELHDAGVEIHQSHNKTVKVLADGVSEDPGIFFWMADDIEALFVLANVGSDGPGLAFRTHDSTLISIFRSTFERREPNQQAYLPPQAPQHNT